uniref:Piezo-type mechanosensitive ion channel component n=1 Tax=Globodera pallida TaxID=36090 RepID=A0A183CAA2_GLOPA
MVALTAKIVLVKVFLPLFLISGAILRPKITRLFTFLCVAFSLLTTLAQFGYQLYQHLKYPDDGDYIKEACNSSSNDDFWLRQTGFIRVPSGAYEPIIFRLFLPELLALLGSLVTFIACSFYPTDLPPFEVIGHESTEEQIAETETVLSDGQEEPTAERPSEAELNRQYSETLVFASKRTSDAFIVLAVCVVGILMPSLLNAPYFLFMLLVMTCYQMEFFQQLLPYESFYARLAYVEFLLLAQYVFSMNLHKRELGLTESVELVGFRLEQSRTDAFMTLLLKIILSLPLFVLLRLHLREDYYNSLSGRERLRYFNYGTFTPNNSPTNAGRRTHTFSRNEGPFACISHLLTKYWIFLTAFCILASFRFFRKVVFAFFTVLIIYASVVLLSIYCYQFKGVPEFWQNWTGVDETVWNDIGLIDYKANEFGVLFTILTKLISLLVVTMLQLKFFHSPWSKLVSDSVGAGHSDDVETTDGARAGL